MHIFCILFSFWTLSIKDSVTRSTGSIFVGLLTARWWGMLVLTQLWNTCPKLWKCQNALAPELGAGKGFLILLACQICSWCAFPWSIILSLCRNILFLFHRVASQMTRPVNNHSRAQAFCVYYFCALILRAVKASPWCADRANGAGDVGWQAWLMSIIAPQTFTASS